MTNERHKVTRLTPGGFYARRLLDGRMPDKWFGHNSRVMRASSWQALERMKERTRAWHDILTRNSEGCNGRILAMEAGDFEFTNNVHEWT